MENEKGSDYFREIIDLLNKLLHPLGMLPIEENPFFSIRVTNPQDFSISFHKEGCVPVDWIIDTRITIQIDGYTWETFYTEDVLPGRVVESRQELAEWFMLCMTEPVEISYTPSGNIEINISGKTDTFAKIRLQDEKITSTFVKRYHPYHTLTESEKKDYIWTIRTLTGFNIFTNEQLQTIFESKKILLNKHERSEYFSAVKAFIFLPVVLSVFVSLVRFSFQEGLYAALCGTPFVLYAIILYFITKRRLHLKELRMYYTDEQLENAIKEIFGDKSWLFISYFPRYMVCARIVQKKGYSWSERFYLFKEKDCLLVRGLPIPGQSSDLISLWKTRQTEKTFINTLLKQRTLIKK